MKYVYPVILTPHENQISVRSPDLRGLHTCGGDLAEALEMARDALEMWLWDAENDGRAIPPASAAAAIKVEPGETVSLVVADTGEYRRRRELRSVKKTLSVPAWLNVQAEKAGANFSRILQRGLKDYLADKGERP